MSPIFLLKRKKLKKVLAYSEFFCTFASGNNKQDCVMEYIVEKSLRNFPAWEGGKYTLNKLIENGDCERVEELFDEIFGEGTPTETEINDTLWFERDFIAKHLDYTDWDAYEVGEEDDDEEDDEDEDRTDFYRLMEK